MGDTARNTDTFSNTAWTRITGLLADIHALPFNRELAGGTLSRRRFRGYITQDALYLGQYARILALAGARGPDGSVLHAFASCALEAVAVEQALHEQYLAQFGVDAAQVANRRAIARLPRLHQFPARHGLSRAVGGAGGGAAAVLLDLLGRRQRDRRAAPPRTIRIAPGSTPMPTKASARRSAR